MKRREVVSRFAEVPTGAGLFLIPDTKHMTFWDGDGGLVALEAFLLRHPIAPNR